MKSPGHMAAIAVGICGVLIMLDVGRSHVVLGLAFICLAITLIFRTGGGTGP